MPESSSCRRNGDCCRSGGPPSARRALVRGTRGRVASRSAHLSVERAPADPLTAAHVVAAHVRVRACVRACSQPTRSAGSRSSAPGSLLGTRGERRGLKVRKVNGVGPALGVRVRTSDQLWRVHAASLGRERRADARAAPSAHQPFALVRRLNLEPVRIVRGHRRQADGGHHHVRWVGRPLTLLRGCAACGLSGACAAHGAAVDT